jgi:polysaccharide chain length determinant protein (PEP-CTERM system associated)
MDLQQLDIIRKYVNLLMNGHKLIVFAVLAAISVALYLYIDSPELYRSSATIVYQEQQVNPSRFSPDQKIDIGEMLNTVSQQVMSRTNLESMIRRFDLYPTMRDNAPIEDVIEYMREKTIDVKREGGGNVFSVSYKGRDPEKVKQVTNALSVKFIEENLRVREQRARETADYIDDELRMSKETLNEKEEQMRDYKLKYYNEMPQQREANMNRLNNLQEQLQAVQANIQNLEQTRLLVAEQLEILEQMQAEAQARGDADPGAGGPAGSLAEARDRLRELRSRYTDQHPSVVRMQKRVEQLESEVARLESSGSRSAAAAQAARVGTSDRPSRIQELAFQLKEIDLDLQALRKESDNIRSQIKKYEKWIEAAPIREAEWADLTRDYEELKEYHDELLSRSLAARAAESLEMRQRGSQFRVIDAAFLPESPLKGTFLKIFLVGAFLGLALSSGLILGYDLLDTSFKSAREIEDTLKMSVVCALPMIITEKEKKRIRNINILWYALFCCWFIAWAAATFFFWSRGKIVI